MLLEAVLSGTCVPWFGSGISAESLPNVQNLLLRGLVALYERGTPGEATCPFFSTLTQIISLAGPPAVDIQIHPMTWTNHERDQLLTKLSQQYAAILAINVRVPGTPLSMRWDILDLIGTYSDPVVQPDAEHTFIAFLVEEGVFPDMVTTNWDALIERADIASAPRAEQRIHSIACNEELDTTSAPNRVRLYKIHGCAVKAQHDSTRYKPYLVATQLELGRWTTEESRRPFREAVSTLLRQRSVVFVGLSGQDFDVQVQFITATLGRVAFDPAHPRAMFCETSLTPNHRTILTALYGEREYGIHGANIDQNAAIPLFGKPLLGALCLKVLFEKATLVIDAGVGTFRASTVAFLGRTLTELRSFVLGYFDSVHDRARVDESCAKFTAFSVPRWERLSRCIGDKKCPRHR